MKERYDEEEKKVKAAQEHVEGLRKSLKLTDVEEKAIDPEVKQESQRLDTARATELHPYIEAKRQLQELMKRLMFLKLKLMSCATDMNPPTTIVEIIDLAGPARMPISPNRVLASCLLVIGALFAGTGVFVLRRGSQRAEPSLK